MTKKRVAEVYSFLAMASMKRMADDEKIALIRLLRSMKPIAREMQDAVDDAVAKAREDGMDQQQTLDFVNKAVEDLATEDITIDIAVMTTMAFDRLTLSNDWNFAQIEELSELLVKAEK